MSDILWFFGTLSAGIVIGFMSFFMNAPDEWDWRDKIEAIDAQRACDKRYMYAWVADIKGEYHCVETVK